MTPNFAPTQASCGDCGQTMYYLDAFSFVCQNSGCPSYGATYKLTAEQTGEPAKKPEPEKQPEPQQPMDDLNVNAAGHGQQEIEPQPQPVVENDPQDGVAPAPPA